MNQFFHNLLGIGLEPGDLSISQVSARAFVVFTAALVMVRLGDKRFLSRKTAFDAVLGFILASMLARAINGSAPLIPTLVGGLGIVLLHRALAWLSARWHGFGGLIKGHPDIVVQNGRLNEQALKANDLSERDLMEDLRLNGGLDNLSNVALAQIERNGDISVVRRES